MYFAEDSLAEGVGPEAPAAEEHTQTDANAARLVQSP